MQQKERFAWEVRPMALRENMVSGENYRFTVLTPNLLRLEYSPNGAFEDRASQVAFYRDFPRSTFTHSVEDGVLTLQTEALQLRYKLGEAFAEDTLSVKLLVEPASAWHFGEDFEDLGGTARTLDEVDGTCPTGQGVCSRNGFSVIDDSESLLLGGDGWIELRQEGARDYYFFGYGLDYIGAVQALYRLTGVPPLLPAYALVTGGTVTRDLDTNTTWVCVEADASETVTVTVSGQRLIHDNCDVAERMEHVVQLANTAFFSKNRLLRMMDASRFKSLRQQVSSFRGSGLASGKAMVELLTLTEDPYLGSQL